MSYNLPKKAREFVLFQRTELLPKERNLGLVSRGFVRLGMKNRHAEFVRQYASSAPGLIDAQYFELMQEKAEALLQHIPVSTSSILDIGCGIAALDLFLYKNLNSPRLFILDKTETEKKIWYKFEEKGAFYNSLELAEETLTTNGVPQSDIVMVEAPSDGSIPLPPKSIELIISTISWGFHYPVDTYLESVTKLLNNKGVLIIDIRIDTDGELKLKKTFKTEVISEKGKMKTLKCSLK